MILPALPLPPQSNIRFFLYDEMRIFLPRCFSSGDEDDTVVDVDDDEDAVCIVDDIQFDFCNLGFSKLFYVKKTLILPSCCKKY